MGLLYALLSLQSIKRIQLILSGYYNPILAYGEEKAVQDAKEAGASGFIIVDLPPEEAVRFRELCASKEYVNRLYYRINLGMLISSKVYLIFL